MKSKTPKTKVNPSNNKSPRAIENPDNFLKQKPIFSFVLCDKEHNQWSLQCCKNLWKNVIEHLASFESQTWEEIITSSGGKSSKKGGSNNHAIPIDELCPEAQKRLRILNLDDHDSLMSIRVGNVRRIWGIRDNSTLRILWFDDGHNICPVD